MGRVHINFTWERKKESVTNGNGIDILTAKVQNYPDF